MSKFLIFEILYFLILQIDFLILANKCLILENEVFFINFRKSKGIFYFLIPEIKFLISELNF